MLMKWPRLSLLSIKIKFKRKTLYLKIVKIYSFRLSDALLEKETLDLRQIKEILGERPFGLPKEMREILSEEAEEHFKEEVSEEPKE